MPTPELTADRFEPSPRLAVAILVGVTLAAMCRLCTAEFSGWDDDLYLAHNPVYVNPSAASLGHYWSHDFFKLYAPVSGTVWAALALVARADTPDANGSVLNPYVFHAFNLLVHVATVLAVFSLLRRLLKSGWTALAGALVFAVHPLQVEAVGWATGLKDLLAGLGSIGAMALYFAAVETEGPRRRRMLYATAVVVFALALLSKASAMTTPAIVLAIDLLWYRRPAKTALGWTLPWFALAAAAAVVAKVLQPEVHVAYDTPLWARPLVVGHALSFYLGKLLWPMELGFDYGQAPEFVLRTRWVYFAWIVPVALLAVFAWAYRRGWRVPLLAAAIFVLAPFHVLGWVPFDFQFYSTTADHYLYVAMLGVALGFGAAVGRLPKRSGIAVVVVVAALLAAKTFQQSGVWKNTLTFVENGIRVNPNSFGFHGSLAVIANLRGDRETALHHANRAIEIQPRYWNSYFDRGNILAAMGDLEGAIADYRIAHKLNNEEPAVLVKLATALAARQRFDEAADALAAALRLEPNHVEALTQYGTLQLHRGQVDHAERLLRRAAELEPGNVRVRVRLARVLLAQGRTDQAMEQLRQAESIRPDHPELLELLRMLGRR